ncbi:MAG TPA: hypothetical protein VL614_03800 [Acetobacteraceae bacterium]|jgi:hypothetical protein|nr:hypothetical protein [Acetobacteraceae bacterium]
MQLEESVLSWAHFGDLHLKEDSARNRSDVPALIEVPNRNGHKW